MEETLHCPVVKERCKKMDERKNRLKFWPDIYYFYHILFLAYQDEKIDGRKK
jgi:hypothetical protein